MTNCEMKENLYNLKEELAKDPTLADNKEFQKLKDYLESNVRLIPGEVGVVTGGSSTKLGANIFESMGMNRTSSRAGHQAQHIIPVQVKNHDIIRKIGMDFDNYTNGIFLRSNGSSTMSTHRGYHSIYNEFVKSKLDNLDINKSVFELQEEVLDIKNKLRKLMESGTPIYENKGGSLDLLDRLFDKL